LGRKDNFFVWKMPMLRFRSRHFILYFFHDIFDGFDPERVSKKFAVPALSAASQPDRAGENRMQVKSKKNSSLNFIRLRTGYAAMSKRD
jgi:hypothetical protein